jgi:sugar/nucleoside kinase (ribokinase family)
MIRIAGAGCALLDNLYTGVDFSGAAFRRYASKTPGDGGLIPGQLVFATDLEAFSGRPYQEVLAEITGRNSTDSYNLGGPAIIPLVHAAQMLSGDEYRVAFNGYYGTDQNGERIAEILSHTAVDLSGYIRTAGPTPSTDVLSDPHFDNGRGERTFINRVGAAAATAPESFDNAFFRSNVVLFGGTALVPPVHDALDELTRRAHENRAFVVVGTVYDFRNEKRAPERPWPLVDHYENIDLLVTDHVEAIRISGRSTDEDALSWFIDRGVSSAVITRGPQDVLFAWNSPRFGGAGRERLAVCEHVAREIERAARPHDTTGCGDNFVGGMITEIAAQLPRAALDLVRAVAEGVVAGGYAATYLGGLYHERRPGEKRREMERLREDYHRQVGL